MVTNISERIVGGHDRENKNKQELFLLFLSVGEQ